MGNKDFSLSPEFTPPLRNINSAVPQEMRNELIDLIFHIVEHNSSQLIADQIYRIICQSIGCSVAGQPYGGYRYAAGRDLGKADWRRVYDLICRLWPEFLRANLSDQYREEVNRILISYGVVWELNTQGHLKRILPVAAESLISAAISELSSERFAPALELFDDAKDAFDDRPRRDRDTCSNIFDAMESVAKEVFQLPKSTFGSVLSHVRGTQRLQNETISILEALNTLRNRKFGHGMTEPFDLSPAEVDFTYLTCIGSILLFARL